ncbi:hypothetical protein CALCODRAFT_484254 [Calocera cornea HHB12733]|uniref:Uncharacterized protein n=1 Tax=Calocera cornea HHB12733 TaxID=1353952 RepID=A0A165F287_9BASI|nr:hypothetical protein CALCODRAFT_484254 [Calocera cornea HHB12733]
MTSASIGASVVLHHSTSSREKALVEVLQAVQAHIDNVKLSHPEIWPNAAREIEAGILEDHLEMLEAIDQLEQQHFFDVAFYEAEQQQCRPQPRFSSPTAEEVCLWWENFGDQM